MYKNKGGVQMKVREEEQMNKCMADRIMYDESGEMIDVIYKEYHEPEEATCKECDSTNIEGKV